MTLLPRSLALRSLRFAAATARLPKAAPPARWINTEPPQSNIGPAEEPRFLEMVKVSTTFAVLRSGAFLSSLFLF